MINYKVGDYIFLTGPMITQDNKTYYYPVAKIVSLGPAIESYSIQYLNPITFQPIYSDLVLSGIQHIKGKVPEDIIPKLAELLYHD